MQLTEHRCNVCHSSCKYNCPCHCILHQRAKNLQHSTYWGPRWDICLISINWNWGKRWTSTTLCHQPPTLWANPEGYNDQWYLGHQKVKHGCRSPNLSPEEVTENESKPFLTYTQAWILTERGPINPFYPGSRGCTVTSFSITFTRRRRLQY